MENVWAPWRIKYILSEKEPGCIFCISRTGRYQKKNYILAQSKHAFVMLNRYPYTAGHLMVVPNRHIPDLQSLKKPELNDFFHLLRFASQALKQAVHPDALNIGANIGSAAGAGIEDHLHFHIVARWNGDHNFMPVISETMVISEHLEGTYERLLPFFKKFKV